jgi:hypothetical protein
LKVLKILKNSEGGLVSDQNDSNLAQSGDKNSIPTPPSPANDDNPTSTAPSTDNSGTTTTTPVDSPAEPPKPQFDQIDGLLEKEKMKSETQAQDNDSISDSKTDRPPEPPTSSEAGEQPVDSAGTSEQTKSVPTDETAKDQNDQDLPKTETPPQSEANSQTQPAEPIIPNPATDQPLPPPTGVAGNQSTVGPNGPMPAELNHWSWGAFLMNWLWSIGNGVWIGLLTLIPVGNLIMPILLGINGNKWAWEQRKFNDLEHFKKVQSAWTKWGVILLIIGVLISAVSIWAAVNSGTDSISTYEYGY